MYKQKTTNILTKYGLPIKSDLISRGKQCRSNNNSQNTEFHIMNREKIPQQLYNLLEDACRTFYHIVFLEASKSCGIIPNGLKIKKAACIGNVSKNFVTSWNLELTKAEVQLMEVLILEHVRKLYAIEESFNLLFKHHTVQEDWLFRTRNHLEKFEKAERRRKLKKLRKLSNNETLYFKCLERFESHFEFFSFKFKFLEFCNNFIPDFENLYYLLHLNVSDSIKESSSEKAEPKQDCSKTSCKNACLGIGNGTSKVRNSEKEMQMVIKLYF